MAEELRYAGDVESVTASSIVEIRLRDTDNEVGALEALVAEIRVLGGVLGELQVLRDML